MRLTVVACVLISLALGCASGRPNPFLLPGNQLTYEEGERLLREGEALIADGDRQISDGREWRDRADRLIEEGRQRRKRGEEMAARGRKALRAARMLEEAEGLRREGDMLKQEAIPDL